MRILTYQATNENPGSFEFIAVILADQPGQSGKPWKMGFHPVTPFLGSSPAEAETKAQAWWDAEIKAAQDKEANRLAMSVRMSKRATPSTDAAAHQGEVNSREAELHRSSAGEE